MADWKRNTVHEGEITGYTAEGMGVARLDGRVVFIPGTIAGERWRFRLEKVNKTVAWGRGIEVLSPSPLRRKSDCRSVRRLPVSAHGLHRGASRQRRTDPGRNQPHWRVKSSPFRRFRRR